MSSAQSLKFKGRFIRFHADGACKPSKFQRFRLAGEIT